MKKLSVIFIILLIFSIVACQNISNPEIKTTTAAGAATSNGYGYPGDFPVLTDQGGPGAGSPLEGFGGDTTKDKAGNRAQVQRVPVILIHGNGGNANHSQWGWATMKSMLKNAGYNDSEIWAVSYLGANNSSADMKSPHQNNIEDVRIFVDAVIEYLGVEKVVLIGHSLGAGMIRAYMLGLTSSGSFDASKTRFDKIAALITVAGANYGLGLYSVGEFKTGSTFETNTHKIPGTSVYDDTPYGATSTADMQGINNSLPNSRTYNGGTFKATSSKDDGSKRIYYAGITATGDFVDAQLADTGYLQGADLNIGFSVGTSLIGHEQVIKDQTVFDQGILPILQKANAAMNPPEPVEEPPVVTVAPGGGEFYDSQSVTISATNNPDTIQYKIDDGSWQTYSAAFTITDSCTVVAKATNQYGTSELKTVTFTKSTTPPYEIATGTVTDHYLASRIDSSQYLALGQKYGYSANVTLYKVEGSDTWTDEEPGAPVGDAPVVSISPNGATFETSQTVTISATNSPDTIEYKIGTGSWQTYSSALTFTETTTITVRATNQYGTSSEVTATFTKNSTTPPTYEEATATATGHYVAQRISATEYVQYGAKYGYVTSFTLYKAEGSDTWTDVQP